jgi:hypothetical protein
MERTPVNIERAFSYFFKDPAWVSKLLIGAVMVLIPIIGWLILFGYAMRIMREVAAGSDQPLPEWTNFGGLITDGLKGWGISLIWAIPTIILNALASGTDSFSLRCIAWLVGSVEVMLFAAAIVPVAISGQFVDGLQFQQIINRVLANLGDYVIILVLGIALQIIAVVGIIACVVGVLATIAYATFVGAHLWAQAYRRSIGAGDLSPAPRF